MSSTIKGIDFLHFNAFFNIKMPTCGLTNIKISGIGRGASVLGLINVNPLANSIASLATTVVDLETL